MVTLNVQCSMFNGESSLQLPDSRTAALVATLVVATLCDVLLARCSGSSRRGFTRLRWLMDEGWGMN